MIPSRSFALRPLAAAVFAGACLGVGGTVHAANHALIMWIGDYGNPRANLPGIDLDAAMARKIARTMGVPDANIREISNATLTKSNVSTEFSQLAGRIAPGDNVFLYYSGHGGQIEGRGGARCTEGLITRDPMLYEDSLMEEQLNRLATKAGQVVFMNDSCFSGGAATKALRSTDSVPKYFPDTDKVGAGISDNYRCGNAVNKMGRNLEVIGAKQDAPRVLYVAAASATEVAGATNEGSVATLAWSSCLGSQADTDRSGSINGEELRQCAQSYINRRGGRAQTVTLQGNPKLPVIFPSVAEASGATTGGNSAAAQQDVDPVSTLRDLRAAGSSSYKVSIKGNTSLAIGKDFLDFSVTTNRPGYLYVLHVGSDGKTFDLLFPNQIDEDNRIAAGTIKLPRSSWRVRAAGPAGTSHILAIVSPTKKEIGKGMNFSQTFPTAKATAGNARTLVVEASDGQGSGHAAFGASDVLVIQER
ncbi:Caspase domain-containing protein [Vitreoscilla filiformis]|jgi:hypothetical protein|uniref:Caspase domain-containing protein n=1 Tax=Vitreoscilla filiformis TaxID=63 RepID=A0A221KAU8_VITFI|nr:DUF4384 domain-containing protein [Vitreoscilla filiformis]ASM76138.1 Caspase domain-containing protein [Vitreoscilla filiformis]